MGFEGILDQIYQPYFYYSVIFVVLGFVCVKILTRYCNFISQRTKSLLYLIPLALPLVVMLVFTPSTAIQTIVQQAKNVGTANAGGTIGAFSGSPFSSMVPPSGAAILVSLPATVFSVTGLVCIVGLIAGALFALSMVLADDRVARKVLRVILLAPTEYQWLQTNVAESCKKLGMATPKIGVVEDLRPNAFTIGYGRNATIVFSIGLFNVLNREEMIAVASHELAHVKNQDFFFKTLSNALTTVSFFNPLSYVISSNAQRERELLADEHAIALLERPSALGDALSKICNAIQNFPKEHLMANFSSNLLVTSSVLHRVGLLSTHPRLDIRLKNISAPKPTSRHWGHRNKQIAFLLSLLLIASAMAVTLAMADLQVNFTATQYFKPMPNGLRTISYNPGVDNGTASSGVFTPLLNGTQYMNPLTDQPYSGISNENFYVQMSRDGFANSQEVPADGVFFFILS